MKIKAANGFARILKAEGIPWVSCYPTNHVNNALGEEGVPILMMGEERFAVAVADGFSRVTCGKQIGVCTVMANLNAAGIQMAYGAIAQAWEDSSPLLVIAEGVGQGASRHTHYDMAEAFKSVTKWVGKVDRADLVPDYVRRAFTHLRSGRPGPVLLIIPRDLGEYEEDEHPYAPVKGWRSGPDPGRREGGRRARCSPPRTRCSTWARACSTPTPPPSSCSFAELAQVPVLTTLKAKGAFPENHPLSVGRARLARRALPEQGRRPVLDRLEPLPEPLQPRHPRRRQEDDRPVHGGHARHQPELRDAPRRDRRRQADARRRSIDELSARTGGARKRPDVRRGDPDGQGGVPRQVPPVDGVERDADQPVPRVRRPDEGARSRRARSSPRTPATRATRRARSTRRRSRAAISGWGNVSTLGFSLAGAVAAKLAYPEPAVRPRHRRRRRLLHDGQLRGGGALQDRHHDDPHQQRRLLGLRPGLLGRGPRSLHVEGVRPRDRRAWRRWRGRSASTART